MRTKDRTKNKLNTPYRTNAEYARKKANETNSDEYDYEFGQDRANSLYDYEFANEQDVSAKDSPLARGANIANAFSQPTAASAETASKIGSFARHNEEYAMEQPDNAALQRQVNARGLKKKYQENLRQNYNVEFSDDELIDDDCD